MKTVATGGILLHGFCPFVAFESIYNIARPHIEGQSTDCQVAMT
jgi:hypothetical protein